MGKEPNQRSIRCYHCGEGFDVAARAMTVSCPKCNRGVLVDDIIVKDAQGVSKMQTCGKIIVRKGARVIAQLVEADLGVEVQGSMDSKVVSRGPVLIGPKANWKGDLQAPVLEVKLGAKIEKGYFEVGHPPDG